MFFHVYIELLGAYTKFREAGIQLVLKVVHQSLNREAAIVLDPVGAVLKTEAGRRVNDLVPVTLLITLIIFVPESAAGSVVKGADLRHPGKVRVKTKPLLFIVSVTVRTDRHGVSFVAARIIFRARTAVWKGQRALASCDGRQLRPIRVDKVDPIEKCATKYRVAGDQLGMRIACAIVSHIYQVRRHPIATAFVVVIIHVSAEIHFAHRKICLQVSKQVFTKR